MPNNNSLRANRTIKGEHLAKFTFKHELDRHWLGGKHIAKNIILLKQYLNLGYILDEIRFFR